MPFRLEVVTAERSVFSDMVDSITVPGTEGELGVLPHHAPLLTGLTYGEVRIRRGSQETDLAVGGGFLEVRADKVVVLADMAERAEDIDIARAEEARKRAAERLELGANVADLIRAEAALRRAETRLRVARRRHGSGAPRMDGPSGG
ncbi:MAG: F0F1 ATP synthase subunit epsilon [Dehalococcoidia bacterium]|nr:F0F1 ATP synthase subunit epsilon [Dehalococcoidia bacterium]